MHAHARLLPQGMPLAVTRTFVLGVAEGGFQAHQWSRRARNVGVPAPAILNGPVEMSRPKAGAYGADEPFERDGDVAVIRIDGPLKHYAMESWCYEFDGYDAVEQRARQAFSDPNVRAVVSRIDSPGGEVSGCFEAARAIAKMAEEYGKPHVAYVNDCACSAAYALACSASRIVTPDTGFLGSIGVIACFEEYSKALEAAGVAVHIITSGEAKADGSDMIPMSPEAEARISGWVNQLGATFHAWVAERRGIDVAAVAGMQAQVFVGQTAVAARLADQVGNFNDAVALARSLITGSSAAATRPAAKKGRTMEAILKTLDLKSEATEADAVHAINGLMKAKADAESRAVAASAVTDALVKETGEANAESAKGTITAWRLLAAKVEQDEKAAKEAQAKADADERATLMKTAKETGKLDAEMEAEWVAEPPSLSFLRSYVKRAAQIVPVGKAHTEPKVTGSSASGELKHEGKTYAQMTAMEKDALARSNPDLFTAMRDAAKTSKSSARKR